MNYLEKYNWIKDRKHLCYFPHTNLDMRNNFFGKLSYTCCCNLDLRYNNDDNIVDRVKEEMLLGNSPKPCHLCYKDESRGAISERIRRLIIFDQKKLEAFEKDPYLAVDNIQIGMLVSNFCNLACRSCNAHNSSTWAKMAKVSVETNPNNLIQDLSSKEQFFSLVEKKYNEAKERNLEFILSLIGGETFIQQGFFECCQKLIDMNISNETTLHITTNMTVPIDKDLENIFSNFKKIKLVCSIDSTGENYQYVRWPAHFDKVEKSLSRMLSLMKTTLLGKIKYYIQPVYSINNIFYINDNLDYWHNWAIKNETQIHLLTIHLHNPAHLQPEILPQPYRDKLKNIIASVLNHKIFEQYQDTTKEFFEYLIALQASLDDNSLINLKLFDQYLKYTSDYDKRTNSDSFKLNSKLFDILNVEHAKTYHQTYEETNVNDTLKYSR